MGERDLFWPSLMLRASTRGQVCRLLYVVFFPLLLYVAARAYLLALAPFGCTPYAQSSPGAWGLTV